VSGAPVSGAPASGVFVASLATALSTAFVASLAAALSTASWPPPPLLDAPAASIALDSVGLPAAPEQPAIAPPASHERSAIRAVDGSRGTMADRQGIIGSH
jgi:hypothetical protein